MWIWVRSGEIRLTDPTKPFTGSLKFILTGDRDGDSLIIDSGLAA